MLESFSKKWQGLKLDAGFHLMNVPEDVEPQVSF